MWVVGSSSSRHLLRRRLPRAPPTRSLQFSTAAAETTSSSPPSERAVPPPTRQPPLFAPLASSQPPSPSLGSGSTSRSSSSTSTRRKSDGNGGSGAVLPARHSRKRLPLVCIDPIQLSQLTHELLEAPLTSLFKYDGCDDKDKDVVLVVQQKSGRLSRQRAWDKAWPTVQKVEFVLRGHAQCLSGTQWNRWLPPSEALSDIHKDDTVSILERLQLMQRLLERLEEEGVAYLEERAARLEELHGPRDDPTLESNSTDPDRVNARSRGSKRYHNDDSDEHLDSSNSSDEDDNDDDNEEERLDATSSSDESNDSDNEEHGDASSSSDEYDDSDNEGHDEEEDEEYTLGSSSDEDEDPISEYSYLQDFALPGPTTHMYDVLLDSLACHPTTPQQGYLLLQDVLERHARDGGDAVNIQDEFTRPTVVSYNAPIRLAANLSYDPEDPSHAPIRDEALMLAFGAFDALGQSQIWHRNAATYAHLLRAVAKYLPPGRSRGNVSAGVFHHARTLGVLDESVLAALRDAHIPSNGPDWDAWLRRHHPRLIVDTAPESGTDPQAANSPDLAKTLLELPHKWRRYGRVRRHHPREAIY